MLEIQKMHGFQYMDEDSIDVELKCNICTEPFLDPGTIWSCDHIFCRMCIEKVLENNITCPICRSPTMLYEFQRATRNLVNMLSKILVRCECCNQVNIQRGDFTEHINKLCPKVIVRCPAGGNLCIWSGLRDQFTIHLTQCTAELNRSFLNQFVAITKEMEKLELNVRDIIFQRQQLVSYDKLKSEMICLDQCCTNLQNDNQQLNLQLSKLDQESELLKQTIPALRIASKYEFVIGVVDYFTFLSDDTGRRMKYTVIYD
jgi:hypothetical protein